MDVYTSSSQRLIRRPGDQEWDPAGLLEVVLLLEHIVVTQAITVICDEADQRVLPLVWRALDLVQDPPEAGVNVRDLAVVA